MRIDGNRLHDRGTELVLAYYAAFNRGDRDAMLALLADDVAHDLNEGPRETGREAFAAFMARMAPSTERASRVISTCACLARASARTEKAAASTARVSAAPVAIRTTSASGSPAPTARFKTRKQTPLTTTAPATPASPPRMSLSPIPRATNCACPREGILSRR